MYSTVREYGNLGTLRYSLGVQPLIKAYLLRPPPTYAWWDVFASTDIVLIRVYESDTYYAEGTSVCLYHSTKRRKRVATEDDAIDP